jgi:5-oxoprolinase (ATP-hydrolysing) subunit A
MIDLNADMGESFGSYRMGADEELITYVTSANIACGFHAGDPKTMFTTVGLAAAAGVSVGAHVSYPDLVGFGRRQLKVSADELATDVLYQIGALDAFCRRHGTSVRYVKAHGALYNDMADDEALAAAFGDAVLGYGADLAVMVLAGSPAADVLRAQGIRVVREGFADRGYTAQGRLVPRREPGAVRTDPAEVADRGLRLALAEPIQAADGSPVTVEIDSLCVHGDTPGAVALAAALRKSLAGHDVEVASFA